MKLKDDITRLIKSYGLREDKLGIIENLPLGLKLDIGEMATIRLAEGKCNNPVYGGFNYRLPFLEIISYYNQATDMYKHGTYLPFIKAVVRLAERLLKAHLKELGHV